MRHETSKDRWNIEKLQDHAEKEAKRWRRRSLVPATVASVPILIATIIAWSCNISLAMLVKVSTLPISSAFLILLSRILWNYSNVWLGRAGMLEDLCLTLKLIGKPPTGETPLNDADAQRLTQVAQPLERLRRVFEGDLLKGPVVGDAKGVNQVAATDAIGCLESNLRPEIWPMQTRILNLFGDVSRLDFFGALGHPQ
jgi:hypothetical protein